MAERERKEIIVEGTGDGKPAEGASSEEESQSVFLIPYPKIVFLYPTYIASIAAALYMWFVDPYFVNPNGLEVADGQAVVAVEDGRAAVADAALEVSHAGQVVGFAFLLLLALNLVVVSFDFPRTTSLTVFFFLVALGVGLWTLFKLNPGMLGSVGDVIASIKPAANATFYTIFALFMTFIYVGVFISVRFDYWEVRPNELLHHHGVLSDLKRYSAPHLRIEKEINDIFEYFLLGAGRLILHPSSESRSIVLDNVFFINAKERKITKILSALQVRVNHG